MNKKYFLLILLVIFTIFVSTSVFIDNLQKGLSNGTNDQISYSSLELEDNIITSYSSLGLEDNIITEIFDEKLMTKESEEINPEEEIPVIIEFKEEPILPFIQKEKTKEKIDSHIKKIENIHTETIKKLKTDFKVTKIKREYKYLMNGLATKIKRKDLKEIEKLPNVKKVWEDKNITILLQDSVPLINADDVWAEQNASGSNITGQGIVVAIIDTGIAYNHSDLGNCTPAEFLAGTCERVSYGYDFYNGDTDPYDDNGHGTHCAGIVGANGSIKGVAPNVTFLAYKVCSPSGSCPSSDIIAGIENATLYGADVISISLGGSGYADSVFQSSIDAAVANGTVVVISAGNSGSNYYTIGSPGATLSAITVGASDKSDNIASFSSRGFSVYSNGSIAGIKPDVVAPGVDINSSVPMGSCTHCDSSGYKELSGTSMAAPHIAGVAALLKQAHPTWTVEQIKSAISNPAKDIGYDANTQGSGRVDTFGSYNTTSIGVDNNLFMGTNIENNTETWNSTNQFNITNLANSTITYTLLVDISYDGINASLSNQTSTLNENGSAIFNLTVEINNSKVSDGTYYGTININSSENKNLTIPFAILKSKTITLNHGINWWFTLLIKVVSGSYDSYTMARNGTNYVDTGEYYTVSIFTSCPTWNSGSCGGHAATYIFDSANISEENPSEELSLNKDRAKYKWNHSIYDKDGNDLVSSFSPCWAGYETTCASVWKTAVIFNNSLKSTRSSHGTVAPLFFNDANEYWTFFDLHMMGVPSPPELYIAKFFVENITDNRTLTADTWANITIDYKFPPFGVESLIRRIWVESTHGVSGMSMSGSPYRTINASDMNNQSEETIFITPNDALVNSTDFERIGEWFRINVKEGTAGSQRYTCIGDCYERYQTPLIEAENTTYFVHRLFDYNIPEINSNYTMYNNRYEAGISPSFWYGRFNNGYYFPVKGTIALEPVLGGGSRYVMKQNNIYQGYGLENPKNLSYILRNSTNDIVSQGIVAKERSSDYYFEVPVQEDSYNMFFNYSNLDWIGNTELLLTVNVTFNLSKLGKNPPYLEFFRIVSNNKTADAFRNNSVSKVIFKSSGDTTQNIYYKSNNSDTWNELTILAEGDYNYTALPVLPPGFYDLKYNASSSYGNTLTQIQTPAFQITEISDDPPTVTLSSPTNGTMTNSTNVTFECSITDDFELKNVSLYGNWTGSWHLNQTTNINGTTNSSQVNITNLANGTYRWNCYACDNSSNCAFASSNYTFTINTSYALPTEAPNVTIISPVDGSFFNTQNVILNFTVTDDKNTNLSCWYNLDENITDIGDVANGTYNVNNLTSLSEASHSISVICNDSEPQNGTSSINTFYIDLTNPTMNNSDPSDGDYVGGGDAETFSIEVNDETSLNTSSGKFFWRYPIGEPFSEENMSCTISLCSYDLDMSSIPQKEDLNYYFEVKDMAGNKGNNGTSANPLTVTKNDTIAPTITDISSSVTSSTATITWTTDESSNSTVYYGTTIATTSSSGSATLTESHSIGLTSLSSSTLYYYNVSSCDVTGNCNTSSQHNFTTSAAGNGGNGGGGGGGGGIAGGTSSSEVASITSIEAGETASANFALSNTISVYQITITSSARTLSNVQIIVTRMDEPSEGVPELNPVEVYHYLLMQVHNIKKEGDTSRIEMMFKVNSTWMQENNLDVVSMYRYTEEWNILPTDKIDEDENFTYFKAISPGFSDFAIAGYEEVAGDCREDGCPSGYECKLVESVYQCVEITVCDITCPEGQTLNTETCECEEVYVAGFEYVWIVILIAVVLLSLTLYIYKMKTK